MMRALFLDEYDNTIFAAVVNEINYIPEVQNLYCVSPNAEISISMPYETAKLLIEEIYIYEKVDLTSWKACFEWKNKDE